MKIFSWATFNKYDLYVIIIIASLAFGQIGGAVQVIRIISILLIPSNLLYWINSKRSPLFFCGEIFAFIWILYGYISLSWAIDYLNARYELLFIFLHLNIIFSIVRFSKKALKPLDSLLYGCIAFLALTLPLALWELVTNSHFYTNEIQSAITDGGKAINGIKDKRYAAATFGNYNEYVTAVSFMLPYLFGAVLYFNSGRKQLYLLIILFLLSGVFMINASRGGILCLSINVVLFMKYSWRVSKKQRKKVLWAILFAIIVLCCYKDVLLEQILARTENVSMVEDTGRMFIYLEALELLIGSNYMGVGPYGYQAVIGFAPHNMWLEVLCQYGIGVFLFGGFILFYLLWQTYKRTNQIKKIRFIPLAVILTFPICTIINSGYLFFPFFWVAIACVFVLYENVNRIKY